MLVLSLTQHAEAQPDRYGVEACLEGDGFGRQVATSHFEFKLTAQDREDLRWYLEDYLQNPFVPAPKIAARIEARMREIGVQLFSAVFESSGPARRMWARLSEHLDDACIEVVTEIREATAISWEPLRDPLTDEPLALAVQAFVCSQADVLRPATFEQLAKTFREAKRAGRPYHVIHFDGHSVYEEPVPPKKNQDDDEYARLLQRVLKRLNAIVLGAPREGRHGYLLFENPQSPENMTLVDGPSLGKLMVKPTCQCWC